MHKLHIYCCCNLVFPCNRISRFDKCLLYSVNAIFHFALLHFIYKSTRAMREYIYLVEFMYIGWRVLSNVEILRFTFRALNYLIAPG